VLENTLHFSQHETVASSEIHCAEKISWAAINEHECLGLSILANMKYIVRKA